MKTRLFLQLPGLALTALLTLLVGQGLAFGHEDGDKSVSQRPALRKHPQVGAWLILNAPSGPSTVIFSADGTVVFGTQATQGLPGGGGVFVSAELGTWEPVNNRQVHFTAVMLLSDAAGVSQGSITVDAFQTVSTDGQSFASDPETKVIIRDAMYNIVQVIGPNAGPPVTGVRMSVGSPGFPE